METSKTNFSRIGIKRICQPLVLQIISTGPSGVYVCPEPECGFTALKESLLNGHVVVMHQLGRDYPDPEERSPIPEVELDGSEVEFVGTGRGTG